MQVAWVRLEKAIPLGKFVGVWERPIQGFSCTICFVLGKPVGAEYHPHPTPILQVRKLRLGEMSSLPPSHCQ